MKQLSLFTILFFSCFLIQAQSYNITYIKKNILNQEKINEIDLPKDGKAFIKQALKQNQKNLYYYSLKYINGKSVYEFLKVETAAKKSSMLSSTTYKNLKKGEAYTTGGMLGYNEAIKHDIKTDFKWKFEKETKKILGYLCQKAYIIDDNDNKTTVWYTTKIPIMDGPGTYAGVSGLILQVETKYNTITVAKVEKITDKTEKVVIPTFERLITPAENRKQRKKDLQKMIEEKTVKND